jgi:hypothetical protein
MDTIIVRAVVTKWRPAQKFWDAFLLLDPAGINPMAVRTDQTLAQYEASYREIRDAKPRIGRHLGEKLKIAATLGLAQTLRHESVLGDAEAMRLLSSKLNKVMTITPWKFVYHMDWDVLARQLVAPDIGHPERSELGTLLLCSYVSAAGRIWVETLKADYDRLMEG